MTLAIILICCLPVGAIMLVMVSIVASAVKLGKTGNSAYKELKPDIDKLQKSGMTLSKRGQDLSKRGVEMAKTWEEIGRTMNQIGESFKEMRKSPLVRIAKYSGYLRSD